MQSAQPSTRLNKGFADRLKSLESEIFGFTQILQSHAKNVEHSPWYHSPTTANPSSHLPVKFITLSFSAVPISYWQSSTKHTIPAGIRRASHWEGEYWQPALHFTDTVWWKNCSTTQPHRTYKHPTLIVALLPVLVPLLFCEDVVADDVEFANERRINKMHTRTTVLQGEKRGENTHNDGGKNNNNNNKRRENRKNAIELARFFLPKKARRRYACSREKGNEQNG